MSSRTITASLLISFVGALLAGCAVSGEGTRSDRLMAIAAKETEQIKDPGDRLTRLLNLAELQTNWSYASNARKTLARAAETLSTAGDKLSVHTRIAGWVSISELSRRVDAPAAAGDACDNAMKEIRRIQVLADRCQYVRGVADEVRALRGKKASAAILNESQPWVASIENQAERRLAATAIASDLFHCDDYDGGTAMLQADTDAAWRVDTAMALAIVARNEEMRGQSFNKGSWSQEVVIDSTSPAAPAGSHVNVQYGKTLTYEKNFQGQQQSTKTKNPQSP